MRMAKSLGKALLHRNEERRETQGPTPKRALWIPELGGAGGGQRVSGRKGDGMGTLKHTLTTCMNFESIMLSE